MSTTRNMRDYNFRNTIKRSCNTYHTSCPTSRSLGGQSHNVRSTAGKARFHFVSSNWLSLVEMSRRDVYALDCEKSLLRISSVLIKPVAKEREQRVVLCWQSNGLFLHASKPIPWQRTRCFPGILPSLPYTPPSS